VANLGIGQVILETHTQEVVSALVRLRMMNQALGHLIEVMKFQARSNFTSFGCVHVRPCLDPKSFWILIL